MKKPNVYVGRLNNGIKIPERGSLKAEGMDIRAGGGTVLFPQQKFPVPTGLIFAIEESTSMDIRPRSGMSLKSPITIPNAPGTIDMDYRKEVGIILYNESIPRFEYLQNREYEKFYNFIQSKGLENGHLTIKQLESIKKDLEQIDNVYKLEDAKNNSHGIYIIEPGNRIAQIMLRNGNEILWGEEPHYTDEEISEWIEESKPSSDKIEAMRNEIREEHLNIVKRLGYDRNGGYGSTGIK